MIQTTFGLLTWNLYIYWLSKKTEGQKHKNYLTIPVFKICESITVVIVIFRCGTGAVNNTTWNCIFRFSCGMIAIVRHSCIHRILFIRQAESWTFRSSTIAKLLSMVLLCHQISIKIVKNWSRYMSQGIPVFTSRYPGFVFARASDERNVTSIRTLLSRTGYTSYFIFQRLDFRRNAAVDAATALLSKATG